MAYWANRKLVDMCATNTITLSEMERLFAKGATGVRDGWCSAAYYLCYYRNAECLEAYLRLAPSDIPLNAADSHGERPVQGACSGKRSNRHKDDPRCLELLLAAGAHPAFTSQFGLTPLMYAAGAFSSPKPRIVALLLSDPRVATLVHLSLRDNIYNRTAEEWAVCYGSEENASLIRTAREQAVSTYCYVYTSFFQLTRLVMSGGVGRQVHHLFPLHVDWSEGPVCPSVSVA